MLDDGAEVGNYVEVKATRLGRGAKAKHLTYLGDAEIGDRANIGAGTVTVNYDGYAKHPTVVGDGARIGSDTMLVAPVTVGRNASTGAGSVITKDVPDGALAVERARSSGPSRATGSARTRSTQWARTPEEGRVGAGPWRSSPRSG